jgi:hypothetical protein
MLKRVVAIFDATQKVRKSPGTLGGGGDLGHLEGMTAWGLDSPMVLGGLGRLLIPDSFHAGRTPSAVKEGHNRT